METSCNKVCGKFAKHFGYYIYIYSGQIAVFVGLYGGFLVATVVKLSSAGNMTRNPLNTGNMTHVNLHDYLGRTKSPISCAKLGHLQTWVVSLHSLPEFLDFRHFCLAKPLRKWVTVFVFPDKRWWFA